MIGFISWKILDISLHNILLLPSSGVGYDIGISELSYWELVGREEAELYIFHQVTESTQALYGFPSLEEKKIFTELIKISGVGGKVALLLLSLWVQRLLSAIQSGDNKTIEGVKGIGKKMAEKIVLELKDKDFVANFVSENSYKKSSPTQVSLPASLIENIKSTLQNMGYNPRDIERKLAEVPEDFESVEQILPFMIRELS